MSADVLQFPAPKVKGVKPRGPVQERLYFCTTCKEDRFNVDLDGDVWCAGCKGWINNLKVTS